MRRWEVIVGIVFILLTLFSLLAAPKMTAVTYNGGSDPIAPAEKIEDEIVTEVSEPEVPDTRPVVQHVPLPDQVKNIYMSACVAGTPSFRDSLIALTERTEVNSIIIDIKDYSGSIAFPPVSEAWQQAW